MVRGANRGPKLAFLRALCVLGYCPDKRGNLSLRLQELLGNLFVIVLVDGNLIRSPILHDDARKVKESN